MVIIIAKEATGKQAQELVESIELTGVKCDRVSLEGHPRFISLSRSIDLEFVRGNGVIQQILPMI